jgi:cinnamoyl-CoA:phenyllactate CoA-transferase
LEGIKVLELATFIAAPSCARFLADLGADVIKIEGPNGDTVRYLGTNEGRPFGDREDTTFTLENTGKRSVVLNIKSEAGKAAVDKLLGETDIFVTNVRPNALKRAGLDYETLKTRHPSLVMGTVNGYGEKGADADLPGFDFTAYFARGGVLGTLYDRDTQPMIPSAGFGDHQVGLYLASGLLAALYRAKATGRGECVSVSLFQAALWANAIYLQASQYGDPALQYPVRRRDLGNQLQNAYKTSDGRFIQIAIPAYDQLYEKFMIATGLTPLLNDARFYPQKNALSNLSELHDILAQYFSGKTANELKQLLTEADLPFAICQTWDEVRADSQAWDNDYLAEVTFPSGEKRVMVRTPVTFTNTPLAPYERGAFLGEHTREVLRNLGYSDERVSAMIEAGDAGDVQRIG